METFAVNTTRYYLHTLLILLSVKIVGRIKMSNKYIMIHMDDDGEVSVTSFNTQEEILNNLSEYDNGDDTDFTEFFKFYKEVPSKYTSFGHGGNTLLIRGGKIVEPKPFEVVSKYKIE